jgi:hypothetical protein
MDMCLLTSLLLQLFVAFFLGIAEFDQIILGHGQGSTSLVGLQGGGQVGGLCHSDGVVSGSERCEWQGEKGKKTKKKWLLI